MKRYIDWYDVTRNTLIIIVIIMAVLLSVQKLNRTTLSEYLESNGMNIDEMQVEDTKVIYHNLFGDEPDDFRIETRDDKAEFIKALKDVKIRRDYYFDIKYKVFGQAGYSNDIHPSSNQMITTGLNDPNSGIRISIYTSSGRYITISWNQSDKDGNNKKHFTGIIVGDYFEYNEK